MPEFTKKGYMNFRKYRYTKFCGRDVFRIVEDHDGVLWSFWEYAPEVESGILMNQTFTRLPNGIGLLLDERDELWNDSHSCTE